MLKKSIYLAILLTAFAVSAHADQPSAKGDKGGAEALTRASQGSSKPAPATASNSSDANVPPWWRATPEKNVPVENPFPNAGN